MADLIHYIIDHHKLRTGSQIVCLVGDLTQIMAGQKPVQHQNYKAAEICLCLVFQMFFRVNIIDQFIDFPVKGEGAVDLVKIILQHIAADVEFIAVERDALAGLAGNL